MLVFHPSPHPLERETLAEECCHESRLFGMLKVVFLCLSKAMVLLLLPTHTRYLFIFKNEE